MSISATLMQLSLILTIGCASAMSQLQFLLQLIDRSTHDEMTGALNRRAGGEVLKAAFIAAERQNRDLSVLFLDLDRFKMINDCWGHPAGDATLRQVGKAITDSLRNQDTLIRWGGEEFVIMLPDTDSKGAEVVVKALAQHGIGIRPDGFPQTASLGIAGRLADDAGDWTQLVEKADQRMYCAKKSGRNRYVDQAGKPSPFITNTKRVFPYPMPASEFKKGTGGAGSPVFVPGNNLAC